MSTLALINFLAVADWDSHHDGGWIVMGLGMIVFWALLLALIVWLVRRPGPGESSTPPESPRDVLDHRLADGSISVEEYEHRRQILSGESRPGAAG